jgi:hypothetical protein
VASLKGLAFGSLISGLGLLALSAPAEALVECTGNSNFGSSATGSGANCGFLGVGQTFEIDVTDFFASLNDPTFAGTQFGIGIVTPGNTLVGISDLQGVVTGKAGFSPDFMTAGFTQFTDDPIAIWADDLSITNMNLGDPAPGGTAALPSFTYTVKPEDKADFTVFGEDVYRKVTFAFNDLGFGAFGSFKASPNQIGLTEVEKFLIRGTLASVADPLAANVISFGVGPAGIPVAGETFGGFFTTQVPGPLPLAGAGAAFAWSRKLRRKQKVGLGG